VVQGHASRLLRNSTRTLTGAFFANFSRILLLGLNITHDINIIEHAVQFRARAGECTVRSERRQGFGKSRKDLDLITGEFFGDRAHGFYYPPQVIRQRDKAVLHVKRKRVADTEGQGFSCVLFAPPFDYVGRFRILRHLAAHRLFVPADSGHRFFIRLGLSRPLERGTSIGALRELTEHQIQSLPLKQIELFHIDCGRIAVHGKNDS
jgi:hypothetical protein